jgi:hypothetical protein
VVLMSEDDCEGLMETFHLLKNSQCYPPVALDRRGKRAA